MSDYADNLRLAPTPNLAIDALDEVDAAAPELPAPAVVADAVLPEYSSGKGRVGLDRVAHETADGVGVHGQEEGDEEVMGVPERLERLLADAVVRRRVHEQHAEQHDVAGDAAGLGVVDLDRRDGPQLGLFDVEEAVCDKTQHVNDRAVRDGLLSGGRRLT